MRSLFGRSAGFALALLLVAGFLPGRSSGEAVRRSERDSPRVPERVVVIVVDQMRADLPRRFPMPNVERLMAEGTSFPDAFVGHLASETVVSHPVIVSGRWPRNLPWGDECLRDHRGVLGPAGRLWLTTGLSLANMRAMIEATPGPESLPTIMRRITGGSAWAIGAKSYATYGMGATGADHVIVMGSPDETLGRGGRRKPEGEGLPAWLAGPAGRRFHVDGHRTYGTERFEYPLKGDQYVRGPDPQHEGGDLWVADMGVEVMRRESSWRLLMLTMGGVDKVGHMLGEYDRPVDAGQDASVHLARAVADADAAVGRVLAGLAATGVADRTLVVLTSDHGALAGRLVGDRGPGRANDNWYAGRIENARHEKPSRAIAPLAAVPGVGFVMADAALRIWMNDASPNALVRAAAVARTRPGVREVYARTGTRWGLLHRNGPTPAPGSWHARRVPELLESLAAGHAPDLVALLDDRTTYGTPGDHGGAQELSQRIPIIFRGPGVSRGQAVEGPARLVDITPTVLGLLGLSTAGYDGRPLPVARRGTR